MDDGHNELVEHRPAGPSQRTREVDPDRERPNVWRSAKTGVTAMSGVCELAGKRVDYGEASGGVDSGRKKAGFRRSMVTVLGFPLFRMTKVLSVRLRTWNGPS